MHQKGAVLFNELKHHVGSIRDFIYNEAPHLPVVELSRRLKKLGGSQMDLYYGTLTVEMIEDEVLQYLIDLKIPDATSYRNWVSENHHYASVTLSDRSVWILRTGSSDDNYIHIHPGRYSPHTFRVKAGVLKTAVASLIVSSQNQEDISLRSVNEVRREILQLPPLKSLNSEDSILRMIGFISDQGRSTDA